MNTVVIIPSRYGSTRFPGKPLALISGVSMIRMVYERAKKASMITDVVVATDDRRIFDTVKGFGGKVVMTSPDNRTGTDRLAEAAELIGLGMDDVVVNVQGDQPLLDYRCLDELVQPFHTELELEMSTLAFKIINEKEITDPKDVKVTFDNRGYALYFSRSPIPFCRDSNVDFNTYKHLGFYAYTRRFLEIFRNLPAGNLEKIEQLEQLRAIEYGHQIRVVVTGYDSPEVDLPDDIKHVEKLLEEGG